MNDQPDYYLATNKAYEVLKHYGGGYPQIDVMYVIVVMFGDKITIHTYSEIAKRFGISTWDFARNYAESEMGFTVYNKNTERYEILYNDLKSETTIRFTLAHELGHITLGHKEDNEAHNKEANCFARNFLSPLPVRDEYKLKTVDEYRNCFNISDYAARTALDKTETDRYYITDGNYNDISREAFIYITGYDPYEYFC